MNWQLVRREHQFHLVDLSLKPKKIILTFTRQSIRDVLESYACLNDKTSQWIGCIIRKFHKEYPGTRKRENKPPCISNYAPLTLVEHMRARGYLVFEPLPFPDYEIANYLNKRWGYIVVAEKENQKVIPCLN